MHTLLSVLSTAALFSTTTTAAAASQALQPRQAKALPLQGCEQASCPSDGKLCNLAQYGITRFGTAPGALTVSNTSLSLTLADLVSYQQITESEIDTGQSYTDHALFVGAPADFNTTEQNEACALVVLYDYQKLADDRPPLRGGSDADDTSCGGAITRSKCFERLEAIIRAARPPTQNRSQDRCVALAEDISRNLTASTGHIACGGFGSKFNITGAPLLGRHASGPIHSSSECSPVSPPEYKLHKAVDFGTIGPLKPSDREDNHTAVAVVTAVFEGDEEDGDQGGEGADVQFMCLRAVADTAGKTSVAASTVEVSSGLTVLAMFVGAVVAWSAL